MMPRVAQKAVLKESVKEVETVMAARMAVAEDWSRFNRNQPGQGGFYGDCSTVKEQREKDAAYSKFLDQEMVLDERGDSWQRYNRKPPQDENRSATGACTSYAAAGTVTAALMQTRAVVEGKVAMFENTPSQVSATIRERVTNEVMWMVHRQLRQWYCEAGSASIIDNDALVADWVAAMGRSYTFGRWIRQRIGEIDMSITHYDQPTMAVSAVTMRDRKEAVEVAVHWMRDAGAEEALLARYGKPGWQLFDELLDWKVMLKERSSKVTAAVKAVGDRLEEELGVHCKQREVWKAVRQMVDSEDAWLYRDQLVCEDDMEACEKQKLLAMMGTSVEVQKASRRHRRCQHCAEVLAWWRWWRWQKR